MIKMHIMKNASYTIENVDFNIEIIEQLRDLPGIVEVSPIISDNI